MATTLPIEVSCGRLPLNFEGDWQQTFQAMVRRLRGFVPEDRVLLGRQSVAAENEPKHDIGPWEIVCGDFATGGEGHGNQKWLFWNPLTGAYENDILQVGTNEDHITLLGPATSPDGAKTQTIRDIAGTVALMEDVLVPRPHVVINGPDVMYDTTPNIDWSLADDFFTLLGADTDFSFTNQADGRVIYVAVENLGTAWATTFPPGVKWPSGAEPPALVCTDPTALGGYAISLFEFYDIHGVVFGRLIDHSPASAEPIIDVGGIPPRNYGGGGNTGSDESSRTPIYP